MADKLYFDNILVGEIENQNSDFPSYSGDFKLLLEPNDKLPLHILNYIDLSSKQNEFYLGQLEFENYEKTEAEFLKEEEKYTDLIDSDKWEIIESNGEVSRILIPIFCNNEITWRLYMD